MGYWRPVDSYNIGKKGEFRDRKSFTEKIAATHM
jgi:ribonucleoside-triphosphate reductase